ncbi:hypothetical protein HDE_07832 [Halotydeus destructor]|nr:hypothetical protein HDE_07832 [Halotydeus destructor]
MRRLSSLFEKKGLYMNSDSIAQVPTEVARAVSGLFKNINSGEQTLILESVFWNLMWNRLFCSLTPSLASGLIVSQPFDEGVLAFFFNKRLPADVIRYLEYRARNAVEISVTAKAISALSEHIATLYVVDDYTALRCFTQLKASQLDQLTFDDATLQPYRSTFQSLSSALGFSLLVFIAEKLRNFYSISIRRGFFVKLSATRRPRRSMISARSGRSRHRLAKHV